MSVNETLNDRQSTHGDYRCNSIVANAIKVILREGWEYDKLAAHHKDALDMIACKMCRIVCGDPNNLDHWLDIAGYAMLVHGIIKEEDLKKNFDISPISTLGHRIVVDNQDVANKDIPQTINYAASYNGA